MPPDSHHLRRLLLALGGNVGDVAANFRRALDAMPALGLHPLCTSRLYVTAAELLPGAPAQANYLNAVVLAETRAPPAVVLARLQALERAAGPRSRARWAPRPLDLDYLADESFVQVKAALTLPHPRAHTRAFVLAPAADVAPDWHLKSSEPPIGALLRALGAARAHLGAAHLSWLRDPRTTTTL